MSTWVGTLESTPTPFSSELCFTTLAYAPELPRASSALNFMMQRAARNSWTVCIRSAHRGFTKSLPSTSCCRRMSLRSSPRATAVPHQTVLSSPQWTCTPRVFPTSGFKLLDQSIELEEETLPNYQPEKYYPVNQGEVFNDRYQTLAKIGYGVTSTVWLAKDLM